LIDREWHHVYVLRCDLPLAAYRPDRREVIALAAFPARALIELASGAREVLEASEAVGDTSGAIETADLVPYSSARLRRLIK
jgi:hypothetical protein